jgi:hypothetical protein
MGMIWDWKGPASAFLVSASLGATAAVVLLIFVRPHANDLQFASPERIMK